MLKRFQVDSRSWRSLSEMQTLPEWLGTSHMLVLGACWSRIFWEMHNNNGRQLEMGPVMEHAPGNKEK
jgi:hypothetical protein